MGGNASPRLPRRPIRQHSSLIVTQLLHAAVEHGADILVNPRPRQHHCLDHSTNPPPGFNRGIRKAGTEVCPRVLVRNRQRGRNRELPAPEHFDVCSSQVPTKPSSSNVISPGGNAELGTKQGQRKRLRTNVYAMAS